MIVAVKNIAIVWLQQQQGCQQETPFNQQDEDYKKCSFNSLICQNRGSTYIDCFHLHDNDYACHIVIQDWKIIQTGFLSESNWWKGPNSNFSDKDNWEEGGSILKD